MFAWDSEKVVGTHLRTKSQFVLPRFVRICFGHVTKLLERDVAHTKKLDLRSFNIFNVDYLSALTLFAAKMDLQLHPCHVYRKSAIS